MWEWESSSRAIVTTAPVSLISSRLQTATNKSEIIYREKNMLPHLNEQIIIIKLPSSLDSAELIESQQNIHRMLRYSKGWISLSTHIQLRNANSIFLLHLVTQTSLLRRHKSNICFHKIKSLIRCCRFHTISWKGDKEFAPHILSNSDSENPTLGTESTDPGKFITW